MGGISSHSLPELLMLGFPDFNWDFKGIKMYKKSQNILKNCVIKLFPGDGNLLRVCVVYRVELLEEYRHPDILTFSGKPLELDYFFPKLKLVKFQC